jgi:plasmid stabilization system protein ParE
MKVVYGRRAQKDIAEIFDFIVKQDHSSAMAVEADLRRSCDGLWQFPYANSRRILPTSAVFECEIWAACPEEPEHDHRKLIA